MDVRVNAFLTSPPEGGERLVSHSGRFTPGTLRMETRLRNFSVFELPDTYVKSERILLNFVAEKTSRLTSIIFMGYVIRSDRIGSVAASMLADKTL